MRMAIVWYMRMLVLQLNVLCSRLNLYREEYQRNLLEIIRKELSDLRNTDFSSAKSLLPFHLYPVGKITWDVSERADSKKVANALR